MQTSFKVIIPAVLISAGLQNASTGELIRCS